jgi:preprotein translocase subunit SecE
VTQTRGDTADIKPPAKAAVRTRRGPVSRIGRFIREVIAELGKVIWPTRKELVTYTIVVIVFVSIMVALVAGLDILFAKVVLWVFG